MPETVNKTLFSLGQLVATPGALATLAKAGQTPLEFLSRHVRGDWGDIPKEDQKENEFSLEKGLRLMSSYRTHANAVVWIITEGSRSHTTLLLPKEHRVKRKPSEGEKAMTRTIFETNAILVTPRGLSTAQDRALGEIRRELLKPAKRIQVRGDLGRGACATVAARSHFLRHC